MNNSITAEQGIAVRTNNVPRDIVEGFELSLEERAEFDYIDWQAVEEGRDSASFFRYRGRVYDLGEFQTTSGLHSFGELSPLRAWHGYLSDSFFSGILIRYTDDHESVVVATYYA
jgi:hypothetical protein